IEISRGKVSIKKKLDSTTNFTFILDYFKPEQEIKKTKEFDLILSDVTFEQMDFRYRNLLSNEQKEGINFDDLHIYSLNGKLSDIDYVNHIFKGEIQNLTFREKSGVFVKGLTTNATVDSNRMALSDLDLALNTSYLRDYILFEYDDFSAFSDFINRVNVKGTLRNSRVLSKDIGLFAPQVNVTNFDVLIDGSFSGKVNDIRADKIQIRTGRQTWLQGNISIKGLPDIDRTLFDMDLSQLITDRRDLEKLVADLSGQTLF